MRLRILSDLHLEAGPWKWQPVAEDLVILAGDVADQSREGRVCRQRLWDDLVRVSMPASTSWKITKDIAIRSIDFW